MSQTKRNRSGKLLEQELSTTLKFYKSLLGDKFFYRRIADASDFAVNYCHRCKRPIKSKLILIKNPADFMVIYKGVVTYIEAKSSMQRRYTLNWIKSHQVTDLMEAKKAGAQSVFFISYRYSLMKRRHKESETVYDSNRGWIIEPEKIYALKKKGVKSLTWKQIDKIGTEVKRTGTVWQIGTVLGFN